MGTIAFEAIAMNGAIAIPEQYRPLFAETVRVLVHVEPLHVSERRNTLFKAMNIRTKGFKFDREEANERQGLL
ncbi:hypothetical protein [Candidatus Electronema sp. JM]|uniref:hypothetical protein n=1 Tax=Candidatus Electronema sp. JM TaxID=3401571 RepID=UPI003AA81BEB